MKTLVKMGAVTIAALMLSSALTLAQDSGSEPGMGGLIEVEEPIVDGGSYGGGYDGTGDDSGDDNEDSSDTGNDDSDSAGFTPVVDMSCHFYAGDHLNSAGIYMSNTGNMTIPAGSIVRFNLVGGQVLDLVIAMDIVPGGQWGWFVDGATYNSLPAGIRIPKKGFCDAELILV